MLFDPLCSRRKFNLGIPTCCGWIPKNPCCQNGFIGMQEAPNEDVEFLSHTSYFRLTGKYMLNKSYDISERKRTTQLLVGREVYECVYIEDVLGGVV